MVIKIKDIRDLNARIVANDLFGDFKDFKERFLKIKFGSLPPYEHANPYGISTIYKMEDWPESYRKLRILSPICYECMNKDLFAKCKMSLKAVVGECRGFFAEATWEDSRIKANLRKVRK